VGHDDLFARDLIGRCVAMLDDNPDAVLATSWTALIDDADELLDVITQYPVASDSTSVAERYRGLLHAVSGDDDYGVMRIAALRGTRLLGSHSHADRSLVAELALYGRFLRIPEPLYFRRDLPNRAGRQQQAVRHWCVNHDPRRADRLRHPAARLLAEYVWSFFDGIWRAPISPAQKRACYRELVTYLAGRALHTTPPPVTDEPLTTIDPASVDVAAMVPGAKRAPR
jgi:hypothetical protein